MTAPLYKNTQFVECCRLRREHKMTGKDISKRLGVPETRIYNWLREAGLYKTRRCNRVMLREKELAKQPVLSYQDLWDRYLASAAGSDDASAWMAMLRVATPSDVVTCGADEDE